MEEGPQSWAAPGIRGSAVTLNVRAASRGTMALSLSLLIFSVLMCEGLSSAASGAAAAPSVPTTSWAVAAQREIALGKDGREAFSSTGALLAYLDEGTTGAFDGLHQIKPLRIVFHAVPTPLVLRGPGNHAFEVAGIDSCTAKSGPRALRLARGKRKR